MGTGEAGGAAKRTGATWPGPAADGQTCAFAVRTRGASRIVGKWWHGQGQLVLPALASAAHADTFTSGLSELFRVPMDFFFFSLKSTWVNRRLNETNSKAELTTHVLLPFRVSEWVSSSVHRNRTHPLQRTTSIDFLLLSLSLHYSTVNRRTRSSKVRRERSQVSSIRLSARRVGD